MPPKKVAKEKVAKRKEGGSEAQMVAEEGTEPSASERGVGAALPSTGLPPLPSSAPTTSTDEEVAKAVAAAKALQVRDAVLSSQVPGAPSTTAFTQPASTSATITTSQANATLEAQAKVDMGAICQNMAKLQDTLRQMQEQQQAYEAARQAKANAQQFHAQPQVIPSYAAQAPVYFARPAPAVVACLTPQVIQALVRLKPSARSLLIHHKQ
jgi:uncharacterized protein YyaL (SSP411 family)